MQLEREATSSFFLFTSDSNFTAATMANLMIIVFLVEAAVKLINAIGAAKINDLVRSVNWPSTSEDSSC